MEKRVTTLTNVAVITEAVVKYVITHREAFGVDVEVDSLWREMENHAMISTNVAVTTEVAVKSVLTHREGFSANVGLVTH